MTDPHLIIYAPVRALPGGEYTIVTNGDQTDTIYELMDKQMTFEQSLRTREFEDDKPNYTPRISGIIHLENGAMNYAMSILKSADGDGSSCRRYTYAYSNPMAGKGSFIHTYAGDEIEQDGVRRLPSFEGERRTLSFLIWISTSLPITSGAISTRTTRFLCSYVTSTWKQESTTAEL